MRGDWIDVRPLERPVIGPLPRRPKSEGPWPARTLAAWEAWRRDPVTQLYGPADRALLLDLAFIHAFAMESGRVTAFAELRLRTDSLGLSPKGRRDLRWRAAEERPPAPVQELRPSSARARLRAIDHTIDKKENP